MLTVTKSYRDFPAAHRQPNHDGHCRLIHGHDWGFDLTFGCACLDGNGFVIDVGKLKRVKEFLNQHFDHTLLINQADPRSREMLQLEQDGLAKVVVVPNCGMEGLAKFVYQKVQEILAPEMKERGVTVLEVTVWEDSKNRATFHPR